MARDSDAVGRLPVDPDVEARAAGSPGPNGPKARGRRRGDPRTLAAIAFGGAIGAPARYGVAQAIHVAPGSFPWATFWTNVSGSFALGLVLVLILERFPPSRYVRALIATGFLGAYTTYSTFAVETDLLVKSGHDAIGVAYAGASLIAGFLAVWAGMWSARGIPRRRGRAGSGDRRAGTPT